MNAPGTAALPKFKLHAHVVLAHFPVAFFSLSLGFLALHLLTRSACFEPAAYVALLAGAASLPPVILTGWLTWKRKYRGMRGNIFLYKIRIALGMAVLCALAAAARAVFPGALHGAGLVLYGFGIFLLMLGAAGEGFYGGRLNHT
jgi:hypothetical protein